MKPKKRAKKIDHRIKDRHIRDMALGAPPFELGAQIGIDDTHQQNAGIALDPGKHRIDMIQAPHQCPDMFGCPHIGELRHTGARDLMYGLAGGIRHQMDM